MGSSDFNNAMSGAIVSMVLSMIMSSAVFLAFYIFNAIGLYKIAKNRGYKNPWLAWIPIGNDFLVGSVADNINLTRGKKSHNGIMLLVSSVLRFVFGWVLFSSAMNLIFALISNAEYGGTEYADVVNYLLGMLGILVIAGIVGVVYAVMYYISIHKVFSEYNRSNAVLFTVLSILFGIAPFFMFAIRNRAPEQPFAYYPGNPTNTP